MRFGIFYEHQLPQPWVEGAELQLYQEALDQVELADRLGFDYAWEVEHHFLDEYSHSSAPEVFLAACSQRTKRIRLGHGIRLMPPAYNHPARIAEALATLDLVSGGRVEFGTGESSAKLELEGFGVPLDQKRAQWRESVEQVCDMLALTPYPGYKGEFFSMPCRNVVPKPVQKPHPPLWVACSNRETIKLAAKLGIGALTFSFVDPREAKEWVEEYYDIFKRECEPIGHTVNPNIAMVSAFGIHEDHDEAVRRAKEGFEFFVYALGHHYITGAHKPGTTNIWEEFKQQKAQLVSDDPRGIGTPEEIRDHLRTFEDAGVDQVSFIQQAGLTKHAHICEALNLFATSVLPEFAQRSAAREAAKAEELRPYIEAAMKRRSARSPLTQEMIPDVIAYGRQIVSDAKPAQTENAVQTVWDAANSDS